MRRSSMGRHHTRVYAFVTLALALCLSRLGFAAVVEIETVPIGNPGNVADTVVMNDGTSGYGAVGYSYQVGKTEVTNGQYAAFLNVVAAEFDPYLLYKPSTEINRTGSPGGFTYQAAPGYENRPVGSVSVFDAMRFANWLNNGQGGPETIDDGAYTLFGNAGPIPGNAYQGITRNPGATWFLPNENEWYKAAYFNAADLQYFRYPTLSDTAPAGVSPPGGINSANYLGAVGETVDVGSYPDSTSPSGTLDQGGNVWEWLEDTYGNPLGLQSNVMRGGTYLSAAPDISAATRYGQPWPNWSPTIGFRVATIPVPEPSTWLLACCACLGLIAFSRRR